MVLWCRRTDTGSARVGTVAGRKSFRLAVDRNRARRRLREMFRRHRPNVKAGTDMVLVARTGAVRASWTELENEFRGLCLRIGVWRN